jgi:hypothetical protein
MAMIAGAGAVVAWRERLENQRAAAVVGGGSV